MHISEVRISGYRLFGADCRIGFQQGLTVLLGENGSGKSSVIGSLRLLFLEDAFGRTSVSSSDFYRSLTTPSNAKGDPSFTIDCTFDDLTEDQQVAYLPWLDVDELQKASLHVVVHNEENARGRLKRTMWGGASRSSAFEWELLHDAIECIYLPPLRDAEDCLRAYRGSRLARLLKSLRPPVAEGEKDELEAMVREQNKQIEAKEVVQKANKLIRKNLLEAMGEVMAQDAAIRFSSVSFDRIVEKLRLLFYPRWPSDNPTDPELFRELSENSLGYNNLLYLATILAELDAAPNPGCTFRLLLIEEPEAHLHPQLQTRLLRYIEKLSRRDDLQVIITTHSPTIAAAVELDSVTAMVLPPNTAVPRAIALRDCQLDAHAKRFLGRWLDVTKSTLLFARGVILVEGIAEALLMPELSKLVLPKKPGQEKRLTLEDYGVSVISLGGTYFSYFMQLFRGDREIDEQGTKKTLTCASLPIRCAGITDCDPGKELKPCIGKLFPSKNRDAHLVQSLRKNSNARMFMGLKTFEYDLSLYGQNLRVLGPVLAEMTETDGSIKQQAKSYQDIDWSKKSPEEVADEAQWLLEHVEKKKGEFAQMIADRLAQGGVEFTVPEYIKEAVLWATGNEQN